MKRHTLLQYLYLFLVLLFTLINSGCGCGNKPLEEAIDPERAEIKLNKSETKPLGVINGRPVIEVEGEITRNTTGEDAEAFLLVIPKGLSKDQIESIAAGLRQEKKNPTFNKKPGASLPISTGSQKVIAYYLRDVASKEKAEIKATIPLTDLDPGDYELCLLLQYTNYGTAFSNIESFKALSIQQATQPAIRMKKTDAFREYNGTEVKNRVKCKASITNKPAAAFDTWFLFVKKNQTPPITPAEILGTYIKDAQSLPSAEYCLHIADNKAIARKANIRATKNAFSVWVPYDQDDTTQPFERGVTYAVYGVMMYEEDGIKKYVVSEPIDMTTPSASVTLAMKKIVIESLFKCLDDLTTSAAPEQLTINYEAEITKNEGTTRSAMGLLFVEKNAALTQPDAQTKVTALRAATETEGYYTHDNDILYILSAGDYTDGKTGTVANTITTTHIPLELGKTYYVYAFVQDAAPTGEVFLSGKLELKVPKVEIDRVTFNSDPDSKGVWDWHGEITTLGISNALRKGFITSEDAAIMTKDEAKEMLQKVIEDANRDEFAKDGDPNKKEYAFQHIFGSGLYFERSPKKTNKTYFAHNEVANKATDETNPLPMQAVVAGTNFVFWKKIDQKFFYTKDPVVDPPIFLNEIDQTLAPEYDYRQYVAHNDGQDVICFHNGFFRRKKDAKHGTPFEWLNETLVTTETIGPENKILKDYLLECFIKGLNPEQVQQHKEKFMVGYAFEDPQDKRERTIWRIELTTRFSKIVSGKQFLEMVPEGGLSYDSHDMKKQKRFIDVKRYRREMYKAIMTQHPGHKKGDKYKRAQEDAILTAIIPNLSPELGAALKAALDEEARVDAFVTAIKDETQAELHKTAQGNAFIDMLNGDESKKTLFYQSLKQAIITQYHPNAVPDHTGAIDADKAGITMKFSMLLTQKDRALAIAFGRAMGAAGAAAMPPETQAMMDRLMAAMAAAGDGAMTLDQLRAAMESGGALTPDQQAIIDQLIAAAMAGAGAP